MAEDGFSDTSPDEDGGSEELPQDLRDFPVADDRPRPIKSDSAFRTISEVAEELNVPQHVLRFWETKFTQIRPLKRGGGRRYYRPEDGALLKRVRTLLYTDGLTIRGVQKLLREGPAKAAEPIAAPHPAVEKTPRMGLDEMTELLAELTALRDDLRDALNAA